MCANYVALEDESVQSLPKGEPPVWVYTEWEYSAEQDDELSFPAGIWITILENKGHGWLKAQLNGKVGLIPENHIKYIEPATKFGIPTNLPISPVAQPRPAQTFHTFTTEEMMHSEENSNFANHSDLIAPPRPNLTMSNSLPTKSQTLPQLGATPTPSADKLDELKKQIDELNIQDFSLDIKLIDQAKLNQQKPKNISSSVKGHLKSMSTSAASIKPINRRHSEKASPIIIDRSSPYKSSPTSPNYSHHMSDYYDKPLANNRDLEDGEDFYEYFNTQLEGINRDSRKVSFMSYTENNQQNLLDLNNAELNPAHSSLPTDIYYPPQNAENPITDAPIQPQVNRNSNNPFLNDMMHSNAPAYNTPDQSIFNVEEKPNLLNQDSPFEFPRSQPGQDQDLQFTPWQDFNQLDYFTTAKSQQAVLDEADSPTELVKSLPDARGYQNNLSDNNLVDEDSDADEDDDNELTNDHRELAHRISSTSLELVHQGGVMKLEDNLNVKADALDGGSLKEIKHWKAYTVLLCRGTILIYKFKLKSSPYKFKGWFDLHNAQVLMGDKKFSKKKNVFVVQTCTGIQALFQTSNETETLKWFNAIQQDIKDQTDGKMRDPAITNLINMNQNLKSLKPKAGKKADKSKISQPISEPLQGNSAGGRPISTTNTQSDSVNLKAHRTSKRNIGNFLKGLDKNKDQNLGSAYCWSKLALNNGDIRCHLVELLIDEIDSRGIDSEGIYRLSGNSSSIKKWKERVEKGQSLNLQEEGDINVLTGILKLFFRELTEPLIPYHLYAPMIQASLEQDYDTRLFGIKELIYQLPQVNFNTLKKLAAHLWAISEHCEVNKMDTGNLAIVFGPTLMKNSEKDIPNHNAQHSVIESIIIQKDWMFDEDYSNKHIG